MIYLIDTIGKETGMHLYDEAFVREFNSAGIEVRVMSNYDSPFVYCKVANFYKGNRLTKIFRLSISLLVNIWQCIKYRRECVVYQSFGLRVIDILFILPYSFHKNFFVIAHDIFEITKDNKLDFKQKIQVYVYNHFIKKVICHSEQAEKTLKYVVKYRGKITCFPHFSYNYDKTYNVSEVGLDIRNSIKQRIPNLLFFGQIRKSKGIDILVDAIAKLPNSNLNIIIAGADKEKILDGIKFPHNVVKICRYITDPEMNFLFDNVNAVLLPYKEIYQSGVLENVIYWRKYAIMSDVEAFRSFVDRYPSFGIIYTPNTGVALANLMRTLDSNVFCYSDEDISKYKADHDIRKLIKMMEV